MLLPGASLVISHFLSVLLVCISVKRNVCYSYLYRFVDPLLHRLYLAKITYIWQPGRGNGLACTYAFFNCNMTEQTKQTPYHYNLASTPVLTCFDMFWHVSLTWLLFFGGSYISCRESTNSKIQYHHKYFCSGEVEPQHRPSLAAAWNNFSTPLLSGIHIDLTGETLQVRQSDDTIPITIHNHNSSPANFSVAPLFSSKLWHRWRKNVISLVRPGWRANFWTSPCCPKLRWVRCVRSCPSSLASPHTSSGPDLNAEFPTSIKAYQRSGTVGVVKFTVESL